MISFNPLATPSITHRMRAWMLHPLLVLILAVFGTSCQSLDPRNVDVDLPETLPQTKVTTYTEALSRLGDMTEIYASDLLKLQSNPIRDNTGASSPVATGGEIPRDITEMIKTSLNRIGGRVTFIPYDPAFIQNQTLTGYSNFENKLIPNLIMTGGITEFDRGLATRGENIDASLDYEVGGIPDALPSKNIGARFADEAKFGLARITLDFNLVDFQTLSGIPRINAVNTMEVNKAVGERELGISIFGQTFGLKGTIKRVQGRHAAVRLLVELSMIQMVGKYLAVPYWRLLGEEALPDPVVLQAVSRYYASLSKAQVNNTIQQWLAVYGYDMALNDELDMATKTALSEIDPRFTLETPSVSLETFTEVYLNMPLTVQAFQNRQVLTQRLQAQAEKKRQAAAASEPPLVAPSPAVGGTDQPVAAQQPNTGGEIILTQPAASGTGQPAATQPNTGGEIILTQPSTNEVPVEAVSQKTSPQITPKEPVASSSPQSTTPEPSQQPARDPKQLVERQAPVPQPLQPIVRTGIGRFLSEGEWD